MLGVRAGRRVGDCEATCCGRGGCAAPRRWGVDGQGRINAHPHTKGRGTLLQGSASAHGRRRVGLTSRSAPGPSPRANKVLRVRVFRSLCARTGEKRNGLKRGERAQSRGRGRASVLDPRRAAAAAPASASSSSAFHRPPRRLSSSRAKLQAAHGTASILERSSTNGALRCCSPHLRSV